MFAVTTFLNGRSPPSPDERVAMYLSAFKASSPRTAYSTSRTAGLMLEVDKAFCLDPFDFDMVVVVVNARELIQLGVRIQRSVGIDR